MSRVTVVNPSPPPIVSTNPQLFSGKEDVENWLKSFEVTSTLNSWNEEKQKAVIAVLMVGAAETWYKSDSCDKTNIASIKKSIREAFGIKNNHQKFRNLMERKMKQDEAINEYFYSKLQLIHAIGERKEEEMVSLIYDGLTPFFKKKVNIYEITTVETLKEKLLGVEMAKQKNEKNETNIICFRCNRPGHIARNCLVKRNSNFQQQSRFKSSWNRDSHQQSKPKSNWNDNSQQPPRFKPKSKSFQKKTFQMDVMEDQEEEEAEVFETNTLRGKNLPKIELCINGQPAQAILDSGSNISIVASHFISNLDEEETETFVANSSTLKLLGKSILQLKIKGTNVEHEAYVAEIPYDLILGIDFLNGTKLDFKNQSIFLDNIGQVPITFVIESNDIVAELKQAFPKPFERTLGCAPKEIALHEIRLVDDMPVRGYNRKYSAKELEVLRETLDRWLKMGVIKRASPQAFASPLTFVAKKNGDIRVCYDARKLNSKSIDDPYLLPSIQSLLDKVGKATIFSSLDLKDGYLQIEIKPEDTFKTGFITPLGHFEFKRMIFGLSGAPSTFQRMMGRVFQGLDFVVVYLDDLLVFSQSMEEHRKHLMEVLKRLSAANLRLNESKCEFVKKEIAFLGHIVGNGVIRSDKKKIEPLYSLQPPTTKRKLQSVLGFFNYFRRFVPHFSELAEPLYKLLRKNVEFIFGEKEMKSFDELKNAIISCSQLKSIDLSKEFTVHADASNVGLGATLLQDNQPVAFASRLLNDAEKKYATIVRELLALKFALVSFREYLHGRNFVAYTDHKPLLGFRDSIDPKVQRWIQYLQQFKMELRYHEGKKNVLADVLSREVNIISLERIKEEQKYDTFCKNNKKNFTETDGILYNAEKIVVPVRLQKEILELCHNDTTAGHLGVEKTVERIKQRFYWPGIHKDVQKWIQDCLPCVAKRKPDANTDHLLSIPIEPIPFARVGIDILGPLPVTKSGNRYVLTCTDHFTKYALAFPLVKTDANTIAKVLVEEVFLMFGAPKSILSDRGKNFLSKVLLGVLEILQIHKVNTSSYHPQTNGLTERFNRPLVDMLRAHVNAKQNNWDDFIKYALFAYNSGKHAVTKFSPHFLMFGEEPRLPIDRALKLNENEIPESAAMNYRTKLLQGLRVVDFAKAQDNIERSQGIATASYAQMNKKKKVEFNAGDTVWLYDPTTKKGLSSKLTNHWYGPYQIVEMISPVNAKLKILGKKSHQVVHVSRLQKSKSRPSGIADSRGEGEDSAASQPQSQSQPQIQAKVIADFRSDGVKKIGLVRGDILDVYRKDKSGWWIGKNLRSNEIGWFSAKFVEPI